MIVVHSCNTWLPITEIWLYNQIKFLPSSVSSIVVCNERIDSKRFGDLPINCLNEQSRLTQFRNSIALRTSYKSFSFLSRAIKDSKAEILHSHFGTRAFFDQQLLDKPLLKKVVSFYGIDVNQKAKKNPAWLSRYPVLFEKVNAVLCEGPHMAKAIQRLGCPQEKIKVHHLGVPVERIKFDARPWEADQELKVLMVGSFRQKKGMPLGIRALGEMVKKYQISLTIIGDSTDLETEQEKKKILDALEETGLKDKVRLLGFLDYESTLAEAGDHHIFLAPSIEADSGDNEGGAPVVLIEMMARGLLCIGSSHCDIPEVLEDMKSGYIFRENDQSHLESVLAKVLESPESWSSIRASARKRVESYFDCEVQGRQLLEIYKSLA